jgi:hypothetical protein
MLRHRCVADDPESIIVSMARRLDRCNAPLAQLGLQFVQVGVDPERRATSASSTTT